MSGSEADPTRDDEAQIGAFTHEAGSSDRYPARRRGGRRRDEAAADARRQKLCLILAGSDEQRPADFHSFRRAKNTGLAAAGVNVQPSMRLAGHRNASTHMKYFCFGDG